MTVHMRNGNVVLEQLASGKTTEDDGQASCFQVRRAWNGGTPAPPQIAHQHISTPAHQHTSTPVHQYTSIRPAVSPDHQGKIDSFRVWPVKECPHFLLPSTCRQSFLLPLSLPSRRGREVPSSFTSFNVRSLTYSFILPSPMVRGLLPTSFFTGPQPPTVSNDGSHFNRSCTTQLPQRSFTIQSTHLISHTSQPPGVLLPGQRRQQRSMPRRRVRLNPCAAFYPTPHDAHGIYALQSHL